MVNVSHRVGLAILAAVVASCRGFGAGSGPVPIACFASPTSLVYPLGDTATGARADKAGAWLVLANESVGTRGPALRARTVDVVGNRQEGTWMRYGDSLVVSIHDLFSSTDLRLRVDSNKAHGVGRATTDVMKVGADGVARGEEYTWNAVLHGTRCDRIPKS
jgi:hypothetical protein